MQLRKARNTCAFSCPQSIFLQEQTHKWSVVTDQSLHFRSAVSMGHVEILLHHCLLADVVEISAQTLFALRVLSNAVSPRLVLCTVCENNDEEHMITLACLQVFWILG